MNLVQVERWSLDIMEKLNFLRVSNAIQAFLIKGNLLPEA